MESSGKERRRWSRVPVGGEVEGRIHTVAGAPVIDLSVNGALLEVPCSLRPGTIYPLRLSLGDEFVVVKGRVVRSFVHHFVPLPGGEAQVNYRTAIEFGDMTQDQRLLLLRHIGTQVGSFDAEFEEAPPGD